LHKLKNKSIQTDPRFLTSMSGVLINI
jgi:hypothetical protein